jgi:hypothetical protein
MIRVLNQTEGYDDFESLDAAMVIVFAFFMLLALFITLVAIIGMWKTFKKAGQPGWSALIPIYNLHVMDKIAEKPGWWLLLWMIPIVNVVPTFVVPIEIARRFGKGTGFGLGLVLLSPVFFLILGFGQSTYIPERSAGI